MHPCDALVSVNGGRTREHRFVDDDTAGDQDDVAREHHPLVQHKVVPHDQLRVVHGPQAPPARRGLAAVFAGGVGLDELRGGDLVCFCAPRACHGDLLLRLANATREARIAWWRAVNAAA